MSYQLFPPACSSGSSSFASSSCLPCACPSLPFCFIAELARAFLSCLSLPNCLTAELACLKLAIMTAIESTAAFQARALAIGLSDVTVQALVAKDLATFGKFAFCCAYTPGSNDEQPLKAVINDLLGRDPTLGEMALLRRLFFECHTLALADMRTRLERSEESAPRSLPPAERDARLKAQKARLQGLSITLDVQPSNALVDKAVQMLDDGQLKYIPLHKAASREQELKLEDKEPSITFDARGNIKLTRTQREQLVTDTSSELKMRLAMQRRALALDQAGVASYEILDAWLSKLFKTLTQDPPPGYASVSHEQLLNADKELFARAADMVGPNIAPTPSGRPVDDAIKALMNDSSITYFLLPLPMGKRSSEDQGGSSSKAQKTSSGNQASRSSNAPAPKNQAKSKGKGSKSQVPDGCVSHFGDQSSGHKPICFRFNTNDGCSYAKAGKRCRIGWHVCWKKGCQRPSSATTCSHSG